MGRNGDGFFKRRGVWGFRYLDVNGRYREKSTGKRKQADAREFKHAFLEKLKQGQLPTEEAKWTLEQALARLLQYRKRTKARSSQAPDETAAKHLREIIGEHRRLRSLSNWDIREFQEKRSEQVGPKTVNNEVLLLIAVLKSARLWKALEEDYSPLPVPKQGPGVALTKDDVARLITTAGRNDRWFVALWATVFAYASGCRTGEIKTVQLKELHLEGEKPYVDLPAHKTKTKEGRQPALNEMALFAVKQLLKRARFLGAVEPDHYLLPGDLSKHTKKSDPVKGSGFDPTLHQNSWTTAWRNLKKAAGLPNFRFHDLRHTHITHAIEAGAPIELVMSQVGHVSVEMTLHYTHLSRDARRRAAAAVDDPALCAIITGVHPQ